MPIISTSTNAGKADGYDFTQYSVNLVITSSGGLSSDAGYAAINTKGQGYEVITNAGALSGDPAVILNGSHETFSNSTSGVVSGTTGIRVDQVDGFDFNIINNDGAIYGRDAGIVEDGFIDTVNNTGTISGNYGIETPGLAITIQNSGTISGYYDAIYSPPGSSASVDNSGTLNGSVYLADGNLLNSGLVKGSIYLVYGNFGGLGGTVEGSVTGGTGDTVFDLSHQTVTGMVSGGGGHDTISVNEASGGMAIDLVQGAISGAGESFAFNTIENVVGSGFADTITGDAADNVIAAAGGNDIVHGGAGNDTIDGGAGDDLLYGDSGLDTVSYVSAASAVTVSLAAQGATQATGGEGSDYLSGFHNLIGSAFADVLTGDANANVIHGGLGNDTINGGNGNNTLYGDDGDDRIVGGTGSDLIEGDAGRDTLTGGAGADTFAYKTYNDSTVAAPDLITDFVSGADKIDISALHFTAADTFAISSNGGYTYISIDYQGNGSVDALIKLTGTNVVKTSDVVWANAAFPNHQKATESASYDDAHHHLAATLQAAAFDHAVMA